MSKKNVKKIRPHKWTSEDYSQAIVRHEKHYADLQTELRESFRRYKDENQQGYKKLVDELTAEHAEDILQLKKTHLANLETIRKQTAPNELLESNFMRGREQGLKDGMEFTIEKYDKIRKMDTDAISRIKNRAYDEGFRDAKRDRKGNGAYVFCAIVTWIGVVALFLEIIYRIHFK